MRHGLVVAILLLLCLGVQISGLLAQEQLKAAEAARELLAGGPWLTPTSLYVPEPSLAPLPVWGTALVQAITGPTLWSIAVVGLLALALLVWHYHRTGYGKQAMYLLTMPLGFGLALTGGAWAMGLALVAYAIQQAATSNQQPVWRSGLAAGWAALCIGTIGLLLPLLTLLIVSLSRPVLRIHQWLVWLVLSLAPISIWMVAVGDAAFATDYMLQVFRGQDALVFLIILSSVALFGLVPWNLPAALRLRRGWWGEAAPASALTAVALALLTGQLELLLWLPFAVAGIHSQPVANAPRVHRPTQWLLTGLAAVVISGLAYGIWLPQYRKTQPDPDFRALAEAQRNCDCYLSAPDSYRTQLYYHARVPYQRSQPGSGQPPNRFYAWLLQGDIDTAAVWIVSEQQARRYLAQPDVREVTRRGDWVVLRREPTGGRAVTSR